MLPSFCVLTPTLLAVLGMPYSYPIDVWALAATLFETFSGRILFQGASNNEMLKVR
jgi:serine/threonine-protein kinase PRP4